MFGLAKVRASVSQLVSELYVSRLLSKNKQTTTTTKTGLSQTQIKLHVLGTFLAFTYSTTLV